MSHATEFPGYFLHLSCTTAGAARVLMLLDMPSANEPGTRLAPMAVKPLSISLGLKSKSAASAKPNTRKRSYAALAVDDSDSEEETRHSGPQLVSSFDHSMGGAISLNKSEERGPLVIPAQKNLIWHEEALRKRGRNLLPEEEQARREGKGNRPTAIGDAEEKIPIYGLVIKKTDDADTPMTDADDGVTTRLFVDEQQTKQRTEDEEALDALLGKKKESTLVVEQSDTIDTRFQGRASEGDAFRDDIASRPVASLADYDTVPVEEFGMAMLRGMRHGWKEGDPIGRRKGAAVKPRVLERRPAQLGIGAKQIPEGLDEPGAWGKGAKKSSAKIDRSYNPLVLRNVDTGETLTEEELKTRKERDKLIVEDWRERRDRNLVVDEDKKSRRDRGRNEKRVREESRSSSPRRTRSSSPKRRDREHRRTRDRDHAASGRDSGRDSERERKYARRKAQHRDYEDDREDPGKRHKKQRYRDEGYEGRWFDRNDKDGYGGRIHPAKASDAGRRHRYEDKDMYV